MSSQDTHNVSSPSQLGCSPRTTRSTWGVIVLTMALFVCSPACNNSAAFAIPLHERCLTLIKIALNSRRAFEARYHGHPSCHVFNGVEQPDCAERRAEIALVNSQIREANQCFNQLKTANNWKPQQQQQQRGQGQGQKQQQQRQREQQQINQLINETKQQSIPEKGRKDYGLLENNKVSREFADKAGKQFVGEGYRHTSDGVGLISKDGLRIYRFPKLKDKRGETQANFERYKRVPRRGSPATNGHLAIE